MLYPGKLNVSRISRLPLLSLTHSLDLPTSLLHPAFPSRHSVISPCHSPFTLSLHLTRHSLHHLPPFSYHSPIAPSTSPLSLSYPSPSLLILPHLPTHSTPPPTFLFILSLPPLLLSLHPHISKPVGSEAEGLSGLGKPCDLTLVTQIL